MVALPESSAGCSVPLLAAFLKPGLAETGGGPATALSFGGRCSVAGVERVPRGTTAGDPR